MTDLLKIEAVKMTKTSIRAGIIFNGLKGEKGKTLREFHTLRAATLKMRTSNEVGTEQRAGWCLTENKQKRQAFKAG